MLQRIHQYFSLCIQSLHRTLACQNLPIPFNQVNLSEHLPWTHQPPLILTLHQELVVVLNQDLPQFIQLLIESATWGNMRLAQAWWEIKQELSQFLGFD